jgi:hypothetical protein
MNPCKPSPHLQKTGYTTALLLVWLAVAFPCMAAAASDGDVPETNDDRAGLNFQVIERWEADVGDHLIFYNRVAPPAVPAVTLSTAEPLATNDAVATDLREQKKVDVLMLFATVVDHRITEVRWFSGSQQYRAFSTIDFNQLCGLGEIETADTVYSLIPGVSNESSEASGGLDRYATEQEWPTEAIQMAAANQTHSQYFVVPSDAPPPANILTALDALHVYYDGHRQELAEACAQREAQRLEKERWLKEHPPAPKDTVINFWPQKSSVYFDANQQEGQQ